MTVTLELIRQKLVEEVMWKCHGNAISVIIYGALKYITEQTERAAHVVLTERSLRTRHHFMLMEECNIRQ